MALNARDFDLHWLPPDTRLLPEILGFYGYQTAFYGNRALVSSTVVGDHFQVVLPPETGPDPWVAPLARWISSEAQEPFFAFLGDMDLHLPRPPLSEAQAHLLLWLLRGLHPGDAPEPAAHVRYSGGGGGAGGRAPTRDRPL